MASLRRSADHVVEQLPEAGDLVRAGVSGTTTTMSAMSDPALQLVAAASIGFAAGLCLAGAPRLFVAVALIPALAVGGAILARPERPAHRAN